MTGIETLSPAVEQSIKDWAKYWKGVEESYGKEEIRKSWHGDYLYMKHLARSIYLNGHTDGVTWMAMEQADEAMKNIGKELDELDSIFNLNDED